MAARRRRQLGLAAIAATAVAYLMAALVLPDSSALMAVFRTGVHGGLMVAAAVLCVRSAWRAQSGRAAWWCMAVGLVAYAAGEITWRLAYAGEPSPPYPSWADLCWLATYPAFYLGTLLLVRERLAALSASAWLDGVIGGAVTLALGLAFYFEPISRAAEGDPLAVAMTMAYPLGDILLVALMVSVLALVGGRITRMWTLLAAGQGLIMLSDMSYALGTATGTYAEGHWPDTLSPLGVLLIALAARAPTPRALPARLEGWRAFALTGLFGMAAVALELLVDLFQFSPEVQILAKVAIGLVVLRILLTVRENVELVARVQDQAHTDELTGLPNRRRLLVDIERGMLEFDRPRALTFLDLDGFKAYNDAFGHVAGDELLARLGAALARAVSARGRAYRLGGDEFCILVENDDGSADALLATALAALSDRGEGFRVEASHGTVVNAAARAAERLGDSLDDPFVLDRMPVQVDASIGIALAPHAGTAGELLRHADVAMYQARSDRSGHAVYQPQRNSHSRDRLALLAQLRAGIPRGELRLHFQPQVALGTGRLAGLEALVRWQHPDHGLLAPGAFLPAVEQTNIMRPLTERVITDVLAQAARWDNGPLDVPIAVNVVALNLLDLAFPDTVGRLLA